jgi:hypothetical protein
VGLAGLPPIRLHHLRLPCGRELVGEVGFLTTPGKERLVMAASQAEEDATTVPEDMTNQQDATTTASSPTPEPETFATLTAWGLTNMAS